MGLFSRKKKEDTKIKAFENVPLLPSLPKLPDFPRLDDSDFGGSMGISRLPSIPSSSFGTKFSQNTIKDAVAGEEDGFSGGSDSEDSGDEDEMRMSQQEPLRKPMTEEEGMGVRFASMRQRDEPVFIRIDKFEEALKTFNDAKRKISDIERVLEEIKIVKEREEKELQSWENEVKSMKDKISSVEKDIFSKI